MSFQVSVENIYVGFAFVSAITTNELLTVFLFCFCRTNGKRLWTGFCSPTTSQNSLVEFALPHVRLA